MGVTEVGTFTVCLGETGGVRGVGAVHTTHTVHTTLHRALHYRLSPISSHRG